MRKISLVIIALVVAVSPVGAQGQAPEKALQAAYSVVRDSGWGPVAAASVSEIAVPRAVPVDSDGTQAPCPSNPPFSGGWPSSLRCYYDAAGNLHHWAAMHQVIRHIDSFWFEGKTLREDRIVVGYPAVLLKQRQYNEWVRQNPRFKAGQQGGFWDPGRDKEGLYGTEGMPARLPETGRLTLRTLLIPYYKSRLSYEKMAATFFASCADVEGETDHPEHPCAKYRNNQKYEESWMPNYPNEDMAQWGRALESLNHARRQLYDRVAALGIRRKGEFDPEDCFDTDDRNDCSIGTLTQAAAVEIDALTRDVAAKMLRVLEIEEIRANAEPAPVKLAAPVEWIGFDGGRFQMGSDDKKASSEPRHEVDVPAFEMAKTMVTVEQYAECLRAGQCDEPDTQRSGTSFECNWGKPNRELHPVNCIDWNQANQYARYLGARLPTEAEYEYAAGSSRGLMYPWGDAAPTCDRAVMTGCSTALYGRTLPVCSMPAGNTERGLCDMTGNLAAWVQDRYYYTYAGAPINGSARESTVAGSEIRGPQRVVRGIAVWYGGERSLKNTSRDSREQKSRFSDVGFRLARSSR